MTRRQEEPRFYNDANQVVEFYNDLVFGRKLCELNFCAIEL